MNHKYNLEISPLHGRDPTLISAPLYGNNHKHPFDFLSQAYSSEIYAGEILTPDLYGPPFDNYSKLFDIGHIYTHDWYKY